MTAQIPGKTMMNETARPQPDDRYDDLVAQCPEIFLPPGPDQSFSNLPAGWWGITSELASRLLLMPGLEKVRVAQVKEKWGTLTIYAFPRPSFSFDDPQVAAIRREISKARNQSESICLFCGAAGAELKNLGGWIATVCPDHTHGGTLLPILQETRRFDGGGIPAGSKAVPDHVGGRRVRTIVLRCFETLSAGGAATRAKPHQLSALQLAHTAVER